MTPSTEYGSGSDDEAIPRCGAAKYVVSAEIKDLGASPEEADAIQEAMRFILLDDNASAQERLVKADFDDRETRQIMDLLISSLAPE